MRLISLGLVGALACGDAPHSSVVTAAPGCIPATKTFEAHAEAADLRVFECSDSLLRVQFVAQSELLESILNTSAGSLAKAVWSDFGERSTLVELAVLRGDVALTHCFRPPLWKSSAACR